MNENNDRESDRNCQRLNGNEGATPVAAAGVVVATLEDTSNARDGTVVEPDLGMSEALLVAAVVLGSLRIIDEALSKAVKSCVSVAAGLAK